MADQGNLAGAVTAISSVVVAICAVTVTLKVMTTDDVVTIKQERVLDQAAVQQAVATEIQGISDEPVKVLFCPGSVVVREGVTSQCSYMRRNIVKDVTVRVTDDQGSLDVQR
jgi:uncharacterized protein DUF4333